MLLWAISVHMVGWLKGRTYGECRKLHNDFLCLSLSPDAKFPYAAVYCFTGIPLSSFLFFPDSCVYSSFLVMSLCKRQGEVDKRRSSS